MLFFLIGALQAVFADFRVERLQCEYLENPLGIDTPQPRLSWILTSSERGVTQAAYQVLVASSEAALRKEQGDLWDSGRVESGESAQIRYSGQGAGIEATGLLESAGVESGRPDE